MNEKELTPKASLTEQAVPEEMFIAARDAGIEEDGFHANNLRTTLRAALQWQTDHGVSAARIADLEQQLADQMAANERMAK
jgi:hypothetical protein